MPPGTSRALWGGLVLVVLVGLGLALARRAPVPAAPVRGPAAAPQADAAVPLVPPTIGRPRDAPTFTSVLPGASAAAPQTSRPAPRPTPTPEDSVDARRELGTLAFENAMRNLQGRAEVLARRLDNLGRTCPPGATLVVGCDGLRDEIARDAREIRATLDEAEETARRGWVDPGAIRDARDRHGLREGDLQALLARVEEALRR